MAPSPPESFDTDRLTIRVALPEFAAESHAAIHESWEDLHRWMPWAEARPSVAQCESNLRAAHAKFLRREELAYVLLLRGTRTLVGRSDFHLIDWSVPKCEIGYWVRSRFARQGYITEAVAGLTAVAFEALGMRRVEIRCDVTNERSAGVPRRLGFVHEATLKNDRRHPRTGVLSDTLVFASVRAGG